MSERKIGGVPGGLAIDVEACVGCGRCVRACTSGGIEMAGGPARRDRKARVTETCVLCGVCVDSCPVGAISLVRATSQAAGAPGAAQTCRDVWVFVQVDGGAIAPVSLELLGRGRELADACGCRLVAVVGEPAQDPVSVAPSPAGVASVGEGAAQDPAPAPTPTSARPRTGRCYEQVGAYGVDEVLYCLDDRLAQPCVEAYAALVCDLARELAPEIVLFGATAFGRELAPTVAARLGTGLTADCTVLSIDPETGLLHQTRPAFGGNLMATIMCPDHRPQMATVRGGVFPAPRPAQPGSGRPVAYRSVRLDEGVRPRVRVLATETQLDEDAITDAETLVVVGRGIGSQKNLPLMRRLAELLGAKLGCSRPLVEAGWLEYRHQVGQTGCSVAPKLLVSIGVSGAIQHLAGIGGAQTVIAINTDADAPIFGASHYQVVGDCIEIVREWAALLEAPQAAPVR